MIWQIGMRYWKTTGGIGWNLLLLLTLITVGGTRQAASIGCFVCASVNKSEPDCEDSFNNTGRFYVPICYSLRRDRSGQFPATGCVKMKARTSSGMTVLARTCVVDNGEVNSESEIGRSNHCGWINQIEYNGEHMTGCVLSCHTHGCNRAPKTVTVSHGLSIVAPVLASFWQYVAHLVQQ